MREIQEKFGRDLPVALMRLSTLDKGTEIRPHCGGENHKLRVQLPLYIPDGCCEIQVGNERTGYTEGKVLILDDSYNIMRGTIAHNPAVSYLPISGQKA